MEWKVKNMSSEAVRAIKSEAKRYRMTIGEYLSELFDVPSEPQIPADGVWRVYGVDNQVKRVLKRAAMRSKMPLSVYLKYMAELHLNDMQAQDKLEKIKEVIND